jgi:hypothetical protein
MVKTFQQNKQPGFSPHSIEHKKDQNRIPGPDL